MCPNPKSPYLVGMPKQGNKALVFKANCDEWTCPECAKKKQSQWSARAIMGLHQMKSSGMDSKFVTVTTAEWYKDTATARADFPRVWNKLSCRLRRANPQLMYLLTIEFGKKSGHMHAHFLTNATQATRWYKDNARQCGMGYQAKVLSIDSDGAASGYVSKYIGKSLAGHELPPKFKRVRCSQNWTPLANLEAHIHSADFDWLVCNTTGSLWQAVVECQETKTTMLTSDGEYFDFQDACDTWYN